MTVNMRGKVALVTGASAGIGRATALAFAQAGASVVVSDVAVEGGEETVRMIIAADGQAIFVQADVSRESDVESLVRTTVKQYGRLDYACNNAGIEGISLPTAEYPTQMWKKVIDINLTGVWLCMKHELPEILKQGGAIVNMASILGTVGFANASAYTAAKHGVVGLTKVAALEYSAQGVRINAVCPAFIATPMLERAGMLATAEVREMMGNLHPIKRMGEPAEVANAVVWLCSDEASFVTGHAMLVDGGYIAQ
ncbi:MAG: SDR family oxidoreductase [Herpetosiphonaceae bacterium]|nr:SDR family oxidoreductase [Herpetosiphonaceae bacterium]